MMFLNPPPELVEVMDASLPRWFRYSLGVMELAAVVGLTRQELTRVMPFLVSWAAMGIMVIVISATFLHSIRQEFGAAATTFVRLVLATFVANMRARVRPIAARGAVVPTAAL
jgi:hypothetical protein